jgi:glycosyltransferase involved in cell wall biosynthesis
MSLGNAVDYSIIICTYDPDEMIFKRCLNAVAALIVGEFKIEIILVDNNSTFPIIQNNYVKLFLENVPSSKLINIERQGLSHARTGGILVSQGQQIVFFDDDNEPKADYLEELHKVNTDYPTVAAWGPGNIDVDFMSEIEPSLRDLARGAFQERHEQFVSYSNQRSWQDCYPFGTGLAIRRQYCIGYIEGVLAGNFTLSGRRKDELSSGEDTQMILFLVSQGAAAGVAPRMSLVHIVPAKRTTLPYLSRLTYGTNLCYSTCVLEVFPEEFNAISSHLVKPNKFRLRVLKKMFKLLFDRRIKKSMALIAYIGSVSGAYLALKKPVPAIASWALSKLKAN